GPDRPDGVGGNQRLLEPAATVAGRRVPGLPGRPEEANPPLTTATAIAPQEIPRGRRPRPQPDTAQAATQLRDTLARRRRRLAQCPGVARACAPGHHPGLYPPNHRAAQAGL